MSQRPLNVHRERKRRAPLSFLYSHYRHRERLNSSFIEGTTRGGNISEMKRAFSVISLWSLSPLSLAGSVNRLEDEGLQGVK